MRTPTKHFRTMLAHAAALVAAFVALSACTSSASTHTLNEGSAKWMISDSLVGGADDYTLSLRPINERIQGQTREDFATGEYQDSDDVRAQIQRLIKAGYIEQSREDIKYKNVTGSYKASPPGCGSGGFAIGEQEYTFTLAMQPTFSTVSGQYSFESWYSDRHQHSASFSGPVHGEVSPDGVLTLFMGPMSTRVDFKIASDGNGITLTGPMVFVCGHGPMTVTGTGPGGDIAVPRFSYRFTEKVNPFITGRGELKAGTIKVDEVQNLVLAIDTVATAKYLWHVDLNDPGVATAGKSKVTGQTDVTFRKQPDGTWVLPND